jgi:hypothetical protein
MASNSSDGYPTRNQTVPDPKIQLLTFLLVGDVLKAIPQQGQIMPSPTFSYLTGEGS